MEVTDVIQVVSSSVFILISAAIFLARKRKCKEPKKIAVKYSDFVNFLVVCDCLVEVLIIIQRCSFLPEAKNVLAGPILVLVSRFLILAFQNQQCNVMALILFGIDFSVGLFDISHNASIAAANFWIGSLRLLCNGCLFISLIPLCLKRSHVVQEKSTDVSSKFKYDHNNSSLLSKLTFSWVLPLLLHGYKSPIDVEILEKVTIEENSLKFSEKLKSMISDSLGKSLFWPCVKLNSYVLIIGGVFRLFADVFSLGCALSIKWIVSSFNATSSNDENGESSYSLDEFFANSYVVSFLILLCGLLQAIFSQGTSQFSTIAGIRAKNAVSVLLYEKALKLPVRVKSISNEEDDNESNIDVGHITNLLTEDVSNLKEAFWNLHYAWALPLKMLVIIVLIYMKIGISGALGSFMGIITIIPLQLVVGKAMSDNNKNIQKHSDSRILLSSEVIQGMKSVKLNCLEQLKYDQIKRARKEELTCLKKDSWLWSAMTFLASISTLLVSALIIGLHALFESESLKTEDIFTILALLNQLTVCLSVFPVTLPVYVKAVLSIGRLRLFFSQEEVVKNILSNSLEEKNDQVAIKMSKATFNWPASNVVALKNVDVDIKKGSLTMLTGESSAFFLALINELELKQGHFAWNFDNESIAFVGQRPWISNGTIKDNILNGRPCKEKRYKKVLMACDLDADINILPLKDETEVGEDGVLLSGGQRQRIAIARCLYSKAAVSILDLPFSALDSNLALHIFEQGILKILLKRKRTVIMQSHRRDFLPKASWIIHFNELGEIAAQGSFPTLRKERPELFKVNEIDSNFGKTAKERWTLLKNVTKLSLTRSSAKNMMMAKSMSKRSIKRTNFKRLESTAHLGFCHNLLVHTPIMEEEHHDRVLMNRCKSIHQPRKQGSNDLTKIAIQNDHLKKKIESKPSLRAQDSLTGFQFAHKFVARMTSNSSQLSGVSGFSDDQDDEFDHEGLMMHHDASWDEEEREKGEIKSAVTKAYFSAGGFKNFLCFLLLSMGFQAAKIGSDFLLQSPEEGFLLNYFILATLAIFCSVLANYFGQNLGARARKQLHKVLISHIFKVKPYLFDLLPPGRFMARLAQDMFIIDQKLPSCVQRLALVSLICSGALIVNAIQSPVFLAFVCPLIAVYWAIQHFYRRSARELQRIESSTRSPFLSQLSNSICCLVTLRAFKEEKRLTGQFCNKLDANTTALLLVQSGSRWLGVSLDIVGSVIVFASVVSCLISQERDTFGLALNYSLLVPIYLAWVIKFMTELESCLNAVERVLEYTELDFEDVDNNLAEEGLENCEIVFYAVSLSHGDIMRPILTNLNLVIPQGQIVALVGRSGSGKSTIIESLSAMSCIVSGDITIGGRRVCEIPLSNLRRTVRVVPQEVAHFVGSIKDALDPYNEHTDEDIKTVASEFAELPDLQYPIEAFGDNLAKSMKQELAIVQAVLSRPRVLVLDEATSVIGNDKSLMSALFKYCKSQKVTMIAAVHRLSNISDFDRVLVVGDGRILEDGNPKDLLKKPMGFLSTFYRNSAL